MTTKPAFRLAIVISGMAAAAAHPATARAGSIASFTDQLIGASQAGVRVTALRPSGAALNAAAIEVEPLARDTFEAQPLARGAIDIEPLARDTISVDSAVVTDSALAESALAESALAESALAESALAESALIDSAVVESAVINASSCSVALMTSLPNAARCDVSSFDDDGDGVAGIDVDNMDHGARLANFPTSISVGLGTYVFRDWLDVLRVLWAGADNTLSFAAGGANGQTPNNRAARCGSAVRRALVANWDNVVEDLSSGNACGFVPANRSARPTSCQNPVTGVGLPLRHLFRPADAELVTTTFLNALGLASSNLAPFCNGTDLQDNDPIRVACSINNPQPLAPILDNVTQLNDETCGPDQTTGLVLPVRLPQLVQTSDALFFYPVTNCDTGHFEVRRPPKAYNDERQCPDGSPYLFTGCLTPVSATEDCRCVNAWTNRAAGAPDLNASVGGLQNDGRIWNRFYRTLGNPANRCPMLATADFPEGPLLADARMRYRTTTLNGLAVPNDRACRYATSTEQIGCLSRASECSIGFEQPNALMDDAFLPYTAATLLEGPTCF